MSVLRYRLPITTNGDGDGSATVRAAGCKLLGVEVDPGALETFTLSITDEPSGRILLEAAEIDAAAYFQPMVAGADPSDGTALTGAFAVPVVAGRIEVAIANGGDTLTGEITVFIER